MYEVRKGETVRVEMKGFDENGKIMSVVLWETYGYSNEMANYFQNGMVGKWVEFSKELAEAKAGYVKEHGGVDMYTAAKTD